MTSQQLRKLFQTYFESKKHAWIPGASLVPENDSSVLFTTAGMHPLVPYLVGEPHPAGKRLANVQRCLRTDDIEEVGDASHLTFFEMLGNWSLGDYFKHDSIAWSWEFLTGENWLHLSKNNLAVTVFAGDEDASKDIEAEKLWLEQPGFPGSKRIAYLGKDDNWWPAGGGTGGPSGPDTEIFYWTGSGAAPDKFDPQDKRWVEVWNNVFMQYNREADGSFSSLKQQNVDTGMGLERIVLVVQNKNNIFETDLFTPLMEALKKTDARYEESVWRIIVDHMRAVVFLAADGVVPSNKDQGYVLRRLLRRASYKFDLLFEAKFRGQRLHLITEVLIPIIIAEYSQAYPHLEQKKNDISRILQEEEHKFLKTLGEGMKLIEKVSEKLHAGDIIPGNLVFQLFATYGIPVELQTELFQARNNVKIDQAGFDTMFSDHQQKSKEGSGQKFVGGLADTSEKVVRMHTATHMLHEALRRVLGDHVEQRGSNITTERLRFDFTQPEKMTAEQIKMTEDLVNDIIKLDLPVQREILSKEAALKLGARSIFGEKYGDQVSVYSIGPDEAGNFFSREFCGGPHVSQTSDVGQFKILKEEASSAGVRRIKAVVA